MSQLGFGENPKNIRYAVIVCPKCKQHAQITEVGKKTLNCQHCGALLQARKLRVFHSSEELEEAVAFRTRLQAEISGTGRENFSLSHSEKKGEVTKLDNNTVEKIFKLPESLTSGSQGRKKDHKSIFLELLEGSGGTMDFKELQQKALEKGISPEKLDMILKKCQETGEIYFPVSGIIKLL